MLWSLAVLALLASVQGRAVNISNTWVLPEEGFPVFYRYFRDRISWYEADAVCQFHHANLVTVDTTAQYDALRAYLKELDISSAVWVGLIRSNPDGDFTWTDYRGMSGDGYWSSAPDTRSAPLCAAADPTADYRWDARACGGPMVASFICELPVPQWASGHEGCMVRELPALTVLYLPESASLQLTADCGLAGVKRVQCTGSMKRDELLNNLSCTEPAEDISTTLASEATITTTSSDIVTSSEVTSDESFITERQGATQQVTVQYTPVSNSVEIRKQNLLTRMPVGNDDNLNMIHDNNLESNDIPKVTNQKDDVLSEEEANRLEDEKHMQHKILHNEYARLGNIGNFENVFNQPADHFIPPLVMAKAKLSDDMTVLSLEEKHAQQLAEQQKSQDRKYDHVNTRLETYNGIPLTTQKPLILTTTASKIKDTKKYSSFKKIHEKYIDPKNKNMKTSEKSIQLIEKSIPQKPSKTVTLDNKTVIHSTTEKEPIESSEDPSIDLSVIIKEPTVVQSTTLSHLSTEKNYASIPHMSRQVNPGNNNTKKANNSVRKTETEPLNEMSHEVIKITILDEVNSSVDPTVFKITTKVPVINISSQSTYTTEGNPTDEVIADTHDYNTQAITKNTVETATSTISETGTAIVKENNASISTKISLANEGTKETTTLAITPSLPAREITVMLTNRTDDTTILSEITTTIKDSQLSTTLKPDEGTGNHSNATKDDINAKTQEVQDGYDISTQLGEAIDDADSPLLSAASEPLHRPNRSRRPQQPTNRNKFNPFRMLG